MKRRGFALIPFLVFIVLFLGGSLIAGDFYAMPTLVALVVSLFVGMLQNHELSFNEKLEIISKGAGDVNIITMILIFIVAGAFSGIVTAMGGDVSTVNFGLSIIPAKFFLVGLFIIACFISLSMGTSVGTITVLAPMAATVASQTGFPVVVCIGAVVSGAMFGDNLSIISDTTIAAVRTQGCEMKDKFRENFKIVIPAAIITAIIFIVRGISLDATATTVGDYSLIKIIPYLLVLVGALIGFNVFVVLFSGIAVAIIIGVATHSFTFMESIQIIGLGPNKDGSGGMSGMFEISIISLVVACVVAIVKNNGGIDLILEAIHKRTKGKKGAEFGVAVLAFIVDLCTANNTVAIVIAGPIVKEIGDDFELEPKRVASILDIFASVGQGLIPYGAQLLTAAALIADAGFKISPIDIIPNLYYPILMGVSALLFIAFRKHKAKTSC